MVLNRDFFIFGIVNIMICYIMIFSYHDCFDCWNCLWHDLLVLSGQRNGQLVSELVLVFGSEVFLLLLQTQSIPLILIRSPFQDLIHPAIPRIAVHTSAVPFDVPIAEFFFQRAPSPSLTSEWH